jgi:hypothetical protein
MRVFNMMLLSLLISVSAEAGSVLKVDSRDAAGKSTPKEVYYAQDGMLRVDDLGADAAITRTTLVRDGVIWQVDPRERTFTRIDSASLKQMFAGNDSQMEAMLAKMPPEKRAMMEAHLAQMKHKGAATEYTFTDTGRSDHEGQYACRVWQEQRNGQPFAEYCVVATAGLPGGAELDTAIKKAAATVGQVVAAVPQIAAQAEHITRLGNLNGFPARSRVGTQAEAHVLAAAQAQALPADKFAIPQGFTEKPLGNESP